MKIIEDTIDFKLKEKTAVAIGKFDGIHKGHGKIFRKLEEYKKNGLKTVIFTFDIPPSSLIPQRPSERPVAKGSPEDPFIPKLGEDSAKVLTTREEKRRIFKELSVDYLIEFPFNEKTAAISPETFIEDILLGQMNAVALVCGPDLSFGHKGRGNIDLLKRYESEGMLSICVVDKESYKGEAISSSRIRREVLCGDIEEANKMLLMPYMFYGMTVRGRQLGRTMGMPTVNLLPKSQKAVPKRGVYYSFVRYGGKDYRSITNIGIKPTISGNDADKEPAIGIETFIYGFDKEEIYGEDILVFLLHYVRPEKDFGSIEALKAAINQDIEEGRNWHKAHL